MSCRALKQYDPSLDRRQQGRTLYLQLIMSTLLCLGMCAPNSYWAWDNQTTGISETCTNLTNKHAFPIQRKPPTVWTIFTVVQKDHSCWVPFLPYNLSSGLYFNCNLIHFSSGVKNHLLISQP